MNSIFLIVIRAILIIFFIIIFLGELWEFVFFFFLRKWSISLKLSNLCAQSCLQYSHYFFHVFRVCSDIPGCVPDIGSLYPPSIFFFVSHAIDLSISLIFSKNQCFVLLIFLYCFSVCFIDFCSLFFPSFYLLLVSSALFSTRFLMGKFKLLI